MSRVKVGTRMSHITVISREVDKLRADEFELNVRDIVNSEDKMRYCDECRNWITLQTWTDKQGNSHSIRSERLHNV